MLSPRLTNCPECANIPSLLKKIDCKLAELGNNLYNNISYMLNKPIPAGDILQLITYRRILLYKHCNPDYIHEYTIPMISSRVIRLTVGCISRCNEPEPCIEVPCEVKVILNPTTTTTTTTFGGCKSFILYNTSTSAENILIGNCSTEEAETITLQGLSSICLSTMVPLTPSANIVVIDTNSCTTSTTTTISPALCKCITFTNGNVSVGSYSYTNCLGAEIAGNININQTIKVCGSNPYVSEDASFTIGTNCTGGLCPITTTTTTTTRV